jgi:hypothetical protein
MNLAREWYPFGTDLDWEGHGGRLSDRFPLYSLFGRLQMHKARLEDLGAGRHEKKLSADSGGATGGEALAGMRRARLLRMEGLPTTGHSGQWPRSTRRLEDHSGDRGDVTLIVA